LTPTISQHKLKVMKAIPVNLEPNSALAARIDKSLDSWFQLHNSLTEHREGLCTQQEVANLLEISQPAVSVFENSNSLGTQVGTIISYAAAIGLEIEFSVRQASYPKLPETSSSNDPFEAGSL
jgi:hypothetical protein